MYQHFGEVSGPRRPIRAGRVSEPVGRRGPETSPKCWYMYGPCWATQFQKMAKCQKMDTPMPIFGQNSISRTEGLRELILVPKCLQ